MSHSEDLMNRYAERLLQLRQELSQTPTPETLRAIALDVGITDTDLAVLHQRAQDHCTRAEGYREFQRWDDAIAELEQAVALEPLNLKAIDELAQTHRQRYFQKRQPRDRQAAEQLARQCLQLDPSYRPALELIDQLDQPHGLIALLQSPAMGFVLLMIFGLGGVSWGLVSFFQQRQTVSDPPLAVQESTPETEDNTGTEVLTIPVDWQTTSALEGLILEREQSELSNYAAGKSFYEIQILLLNNSDQEIDELTANIELLDAEDRVLLSQSQEILPDYDATLRPGDRYTWSWITDTPSQVRQARLTVTQAKTVPAANAYSPSPAIDLAWVIPQPSDFQLVARERVASLSEFGRDRQTHHLEAELTNTGEVAISRLKIRITYFDDQGQAIRNDEQFVVLPRQDLPLLPDQARLLSTITTELPLNFERYELSVVEIE